MLHLTGGSKAGRGGGLVDTMHWCLFVCLSACQSETILQERMPYNILSLDGGGSRGVMEAVILKDVMAALTLVKRGELAGDMVDFDTEEARKRMREKLDGVEAPIHPGDVFKMVAGTSTGALMAFGLIHGEA